MAQLSDLLNDRMKTLNIDSASALAERLDVRLEYLENILQGRALPSKQMTLRIAENLGLDQAVVDAAIESDKEA